MERWLPTLRRDSLPACAPRLLPSLRPFDWLSLCASPCRRSPLTASRCLQLLHLGEFVPPPLGRSRALVARLRPLSKVTLPSWCGLAACGGCLRTCLMQPPCVPASRMVNLSRSPSGEPIVWCQCALSIAVPRARVKQLHIVADSLRIRATVLGVVTKAANSHRAAVCINSFGEGRRPMPQSGRGARECLPHPRSRVM